MGIISNLLNVYIFKDTIFYKENSDLQDKYDALKKLLQKYPNNEELLSEMFIVKKDMESFAKGYLDLHQKEDIDYYEYYKNKYSICDIDVLSDEELREKLIAFRK